MEGKSFARINVVLFVLGCRPFLCLNAAHAGLDSVHEGDLEVTGNLDVGGDFGLDGDGDIAGGLTVDGDTISVNTTWDSVGINVLPSSIGRLVIDGSIAVKKVDYHASEEEDYAMFYSKDSGGYVEMFALDEDGNYSQLTSHADPSTFDPDAVTSFGDLSIEVPFSFHHGNLYIGKGAVVDLAALVAEVERMTGRDLAVEYDLPPDEIRALEDRQARHVQRAKESILEEDPEVEIAIEDAWEEVPVTELVQSTEQVTE